MGAQRAGREGPIEVLVIGAAGRMGRHACALLESQAGFHVLQRMGRAECTADRIQECGADVGLDLTTAGVGALHGRWMLEAGTRPVIGTSGVDSAQNDELDALARELGLGGLVVPNFSLGIWLLQRAALDAARHFPDAELIEMHHPAKRDAPSGTALDTVQRMAAARGAPDASDIPVHSLRLPGVLANQEVIFGGPGEVLRITHETFSLDVYSRGILAALRHVRQARGVARGLDAVFADPKNSPASGE